MLSIFALGLFSTAFVSAAFLDTDLEASTNVGVSNRAEKDVSVRTNAEVRAQEKQRIRALTAAEVAAESESEDSSEIEVSLADLDASVSASARAISFARVSHGLGWGVGEENGNFIRVMWVEKTFNNSDGEETAAKGVIKVYGGRSYNMVLTSETETSMFFDVKSNKETIGTLELTQKSATNNFVVWEGTLKLDSGEEYVVDIATKESRLRNPKDAKIDADLDVETNASTDAELNDSKRGAAARGGFWKRFRLFFGRE